LEAGYLGPREAVVNTIAVIRFGVNDGRGCGRPTGCCGIKVRADTKKLTKTDETRMWANAQPDGRPAEHRWRPLFNAAKFG